MLLVFLSAKSKSNTTRGGEVFRAARQSDPEVDSGVFTGPNKRQFLPMKPGRVYVKRKGNGAVFIGSKLDDAQQDALFYDSIQPDGYEIIFIDDKGERLPEIPPPIPSDSIFRAESIQRQETVPTQTWNSQAENTEQNSVQVPQSEVEDHDLIHPNDEDFGAFLESLSTEELRAFEKFVREEISEPVQTHQAFEVQIAAEFREQLGFEDEDDLQRFFTENPELATYLNKYLIPKNEDSK